MGKVSMPPPPSRASRTTATLRMQTTLLSAHALPNRISASRRARKHCKTFLRSIILGVRWSLCVFHPSACACMLRGAFLHAHPCDNQLLILCWLISYYFIPFRISPYTCRIHEIRRAMASDCIPRPRACSLVTILSLLLFPTLSSATLP